MKKNVFVFLFSFFFYNGISQNLENANWCFREYAKVDFNNPYPITGYSSIGGPVGVYGGNSISVSNSSGQLLFYTDGVKVWDKNNNIMVNGNDIGGGCDHLENQTNVIVPKPNSTRYYYIFNVNKFNALSPFSTGTGNGGLHYTLVDMNSNGGNGDVVSSLTAIPLKNHLGQLMDYNYNTNIGLRIKESRISTTLNYDGSKIWLSFFTRFDNAGIDQRWAYQYLIDEVGINNLPDGENAMPTSQLLLDESNFPTIPDSEPLFGDIKFSPNSTLLCDANQKKVTLYSFNNQNGTLQFISNVFSTISNLDNSGYGVEFSPNNQFIYFSTSSNQIYQEYIKKPKTISSKQNKGVKIWQYNLFDLKSDPIIIGEFATENQLTNQNENNSSITIPVLGAFGDLQLSIDGKIYVCALNSPTGNGHLGAITLPNILGLGCTFIQNQLFLANGTNHEYNLPQWVHKTNSPIINNPLWPKVYLGRAPLTLTKSNDGNLFMNWSVYENSPNYGGIIAGMPNLNHTGFAIQPSSNSGCCQNQMTNYSPSGNTNWSIPNWPSYFNDFSSSTNIISAGGPIFYSNNNGQIVSLSLNLLTNEKIIAELNNGNYLTLTFGTAPTYVYNDDYNIYTNTYRIRNNIGVELDNLVVSAHDFNYKLKYNSSILYLSTDSYILPSNSKFKIIDLSSNNFNILNSYTNTNFQLVQVTEDNKIYGLRDKRLVKFENNTLTLLNFPLNNDLYPLSNDNPYSENRYFFRILNYDEYFSFDFFNATIKRTNTNNCQLERYIYDGDNMYLAGIGYSNVINSIGNQHFTLNNSIFVSYINEVILTKLNINTDFERTLQSKFNILPSVPSFIISPNPSKNQVLITSTILNSSDKFTILIGNFFSKNKLVLKNYKLNTSISISQIEKGLNTITLIDQKGYKYTSTLIKL